MAHVTAGDLEDCLLKKLLADEQQGGNHRKFRIRDDSGRLVASTVMSHGWRRTTTLGAGMAATIRRQLGLQDNPEAFSELVRCPLSRNDYLMLVTDEHS